MSYRPARSLAEVTPPAPEPFRLTVLATFLALVLPAAAAIATAAALGPRLSGNVPAPRVWAVLGGIVVAVVVGEVAEWLWRRLRLPGASPAHSFPLRWLRHRIASRKVSIIVEELKEAPPRPTPDSLNALLELSKQLARRDLYTRAHSGRVSRLSVEVGQHLGLSKEEIEVTRLAGLLHDIGKLEIPTSILNKPSALDPDEAELVRLHPQLGSALVRPFIGGDVVDAVRHHHERFDGTGYPDAVTGAQVPLIARLVPVVDTYDALVSDRAYRPGRSKEEAFKELRAAAGTQLDPDLVEAVIEVERAKSSVPAALGAFIPLGAILRRAQHLVHISAAPAATVVTAVALTSSVSLGVVAQGPTIPPPATTTAAVGPATPGSPSPTPNDVVGGLIVPTVSGTVDGSAPTSTASSPRAFDATKVTPSVTSLHGLPVTPTALQSILGSIVSGTLGPGSVPPTALPGLPGGLPTPTALGSGGPPVTVDIAVNPPTTSTAVDPTSLGLIRVAILASPNFSPLTVDPLTACFGHNPPAGPCAHALGPGVAKDVNGDSKPDEVFDFSILQTGIKAGDTQACLTATTVTGTPIRGCAAITT